MIANKKIIKPKGRRKSGFISLAHKRASASKGNKKKKKIRTDETRGRLFMKKDENVGGMNSFNNMDLTDFITFKKNTSTGLVI
jgi:hypothetical protein